jgi:hypothetical protein
MWNYLIQTYDPALRPARYIELPATGPVRATIIYLPDAHKKEVNDHVLNLEQALAGKIAVEISDEDIPLLGRATHIRAVGGSYNREWFAGIVRSAIPHAFTGIAETRSDDIKSGKLTVARTATITVTEGTIDPALGLNTVVSDSGQTDQGIFNNLVTSHIGPGIVTEAYINDAHTQVTLVFDNSLDLWLEPISLAVWGVCDRLGLDCRGPVIAY